MTDVFDVGTRCWFPANPNDATGEAWISGTVTKKSVNGEKVALVFDLEEGESRTVETTLTALKTSNDKSLPDLRNPPILESADDLGNLSFINEPSVLHTIRERYSQLSIYTYSGIVLIAINPFQNVALYSQDIVQAYSGRKRGEMQPHLFAIAEDAYRCMLRDRSNQTIVVSGESGAGKTVSAKYIMRYFATVEDPKKPKRRKVGTTPGGMSQTEEQILATNPIMEAFGNAKTTRNDNSSRFGKYIEILFDDQTEIVGARIRTYLLERSRLVFQPKSERNYHVFYQMCAGATPEERKKLSLGPPQDFQYLNQGGEPKIQNVDDSKEFTFTRKALDTMGLPPAVQSQIFAVLAGLLHIGNIQITATRTDAYLDSTDKALVKAADLLGIDASSFAKWTTKKQITTRSEKIVSALSQKQALVVRDSVAKFVYSSLFDWLVSVMNSSLATEEVSRAAKTFIGVLDIYGFEHFQKNSFEQFCINYANEKLQQEFNQHIFKLEQEEYMREKINWTFIEFFDNQPCIDLIEGKLGILSLLDEESRLLTGTDESWINKLNQHFAVPKHDRFYKKSRFGKSSFTICHYALDVTYDSEGFIEKNQDTVPEEQLDVLLGTTSTFLKDILRSSSAVQAKVSSENAPKRLALSNKKPTLGFIFKSSLISLMDTINSTNVHYIRCIKPNEAKVPWDFNPQMVLSQLRACGVLETIKISCAGFPTRWTFDEFASRYYLLVHSSYWSPMPGDIRGLSMEILKKTITESDKYQVGLTKIFFRPGMLAYLEKLRGDRLYQAAVFVQKNLLRNMYRKRYLLIRNGIIACQAQIRGVLARKRADEARKERAAILIQSSWRGFSTRSKYLATRNQIIRLQSAARGFLVRRNYRSVREERAAVTIQKTWRGSLDRRRFLSTRNKVILAQCCIRRHSARNQLKVLREEARSISHIKEVSYKLENKVIELTQNLTKRTQENKALLSQLAVLDSQLSSWQVRHSTLEARAAEYEKDAVKANDAIARTINLETELKTLQSRYDDTQRNLDNMEKEAAALKQTLMKRSAELEDALTAQDSAKQTHGSLNQEIQSLKLEVERLSQNGPITSPLVNGQKTPVNGKMNGLLRNVSSGKRLNRTPRRRSFVDGPETLGEDLAIGSVAYNPRPVSMAFSPAALQKNWMGSPANGFDMPLPPSDNIDSEIQRLLEEDELLNEEATLGLIRSLKIPQPTSQNPVSEREVLFPAHLINLVTSQMWRYGYVKESERFLANVMQGIQQQVMSLEGEDAINPGVFWLSNVQEMLSFVCVAESELLAPVATSEMDDLEWQEYDRLVSIVKHDLESLQFNIYHTWMKQLKTRLHKMIIPAIIESQSLPGFITNDGNRFLNKLLQSSSGPQFSMDDLINLLNKVYKAMKAYYLEESIIQQAAQALLKLVGVTAFNDLLMRRNFLSWKRGLQINYNITRIEEWCKSHDMPEGTLQLEHLQQATKLLQLKKATIADIEIIFDICWMLTPTQIQKLINQYYTADYEPPISPEIQKAVAARVMAEGGNEKLLLDAVPLDDSGEYEIPDPRPLEQLETYVPSWLQVPNIRFLAQLVASDPTFLAVATAPSTPSGKNAPSTPGKNATLASVPEPIPVPSEG